MSSVLFGAAKIPKKIHFIFFEKDELTSVNSNSLTLVKKLNPDWEVNCYDQPDALLIVKRNFPEIESFYRASLLTGKQADIFKILIVYLYGGFYMDSAIDCLKNLDPLLKFNIVLGEEKRFNREVCTALRLINPTRIAYYMFGSIAGHSFWLDFLNKIMDKTRQESESGKPILESSGSELLTDFYYSKADYYQDITLLPNKDRRCLNPFHQEVSCHFGNYAAHRHPAKVGISKSNYNEEITKHSTEHSFQYTIENKNYCRFYFYEEPEVIEKGYHKDLGNAFKKMGGTIKRLSDVCNETVLIYGPVPELAANILTKNTYIYCNSSFEVNFSAAEVEFINSNFSCCIVFSERIKKLYKHRGVTVRIQVIKPGFRRFKRDLEGERAIDEFKLGCFATSFDEQTFGRLLQACTALKKSDIPSVKIKLYDPYKRFRDTYKEFEESGLLEYTSFVVGDDFFSVWFKDLAAGIFSPVGEIWPLHALEFLYMGIPVILPDTTNYKYIFEQTTAKPTFISAGLFNDNFTVKTVSRAILDLYHQYDHYSSNASAVSDELEDLQTMEETEQSILLFFSGI